MTIHDLEINDELYNVEFEYVPEKASHQPYYLPPIPESFVIISVSKYHYDEDKCVGFYIEMKEKNYPAELYDEAYWKFKENKGKYL